MPTIATSLLDFILHLLRDPSAAAAFQADPQAALNAAGLGSVTAADVHAVLPVVLDYAPVTQASSFDRSYAGATGGLHGGLVSGIDAGPFAASGGEGSGSVGSSTTYPSSPAASGGTGAGSSGGHHGGYTHGGTHAPSASGSATPSAAVAHLQDIINNYTYTSIDDRTTIIDHSVNQDVYAAGDVSQSFDDHSATASGDGAVAGHVAGPVTTGSNNLVADHASVGNTDNSVNTYDSFNDSGNGSGNDSHAVSDSGNDFSDHSSTNITDHSFNPKDSFDDQSDHSTTDSHATSTTTSTTTTATNSGNDNGNFSGNDGSDHSVTDDHSTDLNTALWDSHDSYLDASDNSVNTELHHSPVVVDSDVDDSGNHLHV